VTPLTPRTLGAAVAAAGAALLAVAFYMEHALGLEPCPLCMMQRIWVGIAGAVGLLLAIHGPGVTGTLVYGWGIIVTALAGSVFSIRQLWLQSLPPEQVPACGPGLDYMVEVLPWTEVLRAMAWGSGNCAEVAWRWLGLSIPGWVLLALIGFAGAGAATLVLARRTR